MGKSKHKPSNVSSAANPTSTLNANPLHTNSSTVLRSAFCPSHFQLSLFASVIRSLDAEHLRVHDTRTGHLRSDYSIDPSTSSTCLSWGLHGRGQTSSSKEKANKKRKRSLGTENISHGQVVIAYGTKDSLIQFFSPNEAKVVGTLRDGHTGGVRDFKFVGDGSSGKGWSIGGDSRLVEWDLDTSQPVRTISMPTGLANVLQPLTAGVICASHLAYCFFPQDDMEPLKFNASTNLVRLIISRLSDDTKAQNFLTAAQNDRFMNIFELGSGSLIGSLRTEAEVMHADFAKIDLSRSSPVNGASSVDNLDDPQELLATVNSDGVLELFPEPFRFSITQPAPNSSSTKTRMTQRTRKSAHQFRFIRESKPSEPIGLLNALIHGENITVALVEAGSRILFETLYWQGRQQAFTEINVTQGRQVPNLAKTNGIKDMNQTLVDESHAVISNGAAELQDATEKSETEIIDISSAEEESESSEDEEPRASSHGSPRALTNGALVEASDASHERTANGSLTDYRKAEASLDKKELSFGERLRSVAAEPIDVANALKGAGQQVLLPIADHPIRQLPPGVSLGTVLAQSLRTNDKDLLQTCFQIKDMTVVRATIERLDSAFAPSLVQRLVERFHSRPGRAGSLMVWIQWTLAAHGGYLTAKPEVMKNLMSLRRVVQERANSLPLLLSLKGKLDLLEAQKDLRESMHQKARALREGSEELVVYVEGQSESESESESESDSEPNDQDDALAPLDALQSREIPRPVQPTTKVPEASSAAFSDEDDADSGTEMPLANGTFSGSAEDSNASESEGFFDEEASSTDQDSEDEFSEEVDHDDMDTGSSDGADSPPPKRRAKVSDVGGG